VKHFRLPLRVIAHWAQIDVVDADDVVVASCSSGHENEERVGELAEALNASKERRDACEAALQFIQLVKDEYPHIYDPEGGAIPMRMLRRALGMNGEDADAED
jgi:hypothetical protein